MLHTRVGGPEVIGRLGPTQPESVRPCSSPPYSARNISSGAASVRTLSTEGLSWPQCLTRCWPTASTYISFAGVGG